MQTPDGWVASFGTQVLKILTGTETYQIKTGANGIEAIRVKQLPPISTDALGRKWISWVATPQFDLNQMWSGEANIEGRFIFVGVTAKGVMPEIATPDGLKEPHKIQAALAESLLIQDSPIIPDYRLGVEFLLLCGLGLITAIFSNILGLTLRVVLIGSFFVSTAFLEYYLIQRSILLDVTWSLISSFFIASLNFYLNFRTQFKLRQQIKRQFGKYLDPRMVKKLQDNPELCQVNGKRVDCSIIFTDLRGFTSLSESVEPEMVTYIMNLSLIHI